MNPIATKQNIRRLLFADLISEVDEILAECGDHDLDRLYVTLTTDPGKTLESLQDIKKTQQASSTPTAPRRTSSAPAEKPKSVKW